MRLTRLLLAFIAFVHLITAGPDALSAAQENPGDPDSLFFKTIRDKKIPADSLIKVGQTLLKYNDPVHRVHGKLLAGMGYIYKQQLDTASHILFETLDEAEERIGATSLETGLVHFYLGTVFTRLNNHRRALLENQTSVEILKSIGNIEFLAAALGTVGTAYGAQGDYAKALEYFLESQKLAVNPEVSADQRANNLSNIAIVYNLMKKEPEALQYAREALRIDQKEGNTMRICQSYNALANIYANKKPDSAIYFWKQTLGTVTSNPEFRPIAVRALQNMAYVYTKQGKTREAIRLLRDAQASGMKLHSEVLNLRLANYYAAEGQYDSAIFFARKSLRLAKAANTKESIADAYNSLQKSFKANARYDSAYFYKVLQVAYLDSVYNESNLAKFSNLRTELETLSKERELAFLKQEAELSRAESTLFRSLVASAALIGVLLFASVILFYRNRQKRQRLKNLELEDELRKRSNDLRQQALKMIHINNAMAQVEDSLKRIKQDSANAEVNQVLKSIHLNRSLEKEWDNFNNYFGHLHVGFFEILDKEFTQLSISDKRLAGLVRMNLTNREIAALLNIEDASVKTAKYRLKKKFGLSDEQQLFAFLQQLEARHHEISSR